MLRITSNLSVLLLPVAVVLSGFAPMAKAATGGSRVELVVAFVQSHEETLSQEILSQASILEELGVAGTSVEGAAFQYPMAFLEAFIKDGVEPGISSAEQLVIDSKQVTVPFCLKNRCIFTTFDEDAETGQMEMVSYGGSVRAWRVATAHQRLKQFRPDYKGPIKIVEYPAGRLDFLVIDGNDGKKSSCRQPKSRLKGWALEGMNWHF